MEDCGASAVGGYASDYTPEPASSLASVYDASLIEGDDTDMIAVGTAMNCSLFLGEEGRYVAFSVLFFQHDGGVGFAMINSPRDEASAEELRGTRTALRRILREEY